MSYFHTMKMKHNIDSNIDYFDRHLNRIRRNVSLVCIFLILFATVPVAISRAINGWDLTSIVQLGCSLILVLSFIFVLIKGYIKAVGVLIYFIDMMLMTVVTYDPQGNELIVLFFITPLMVAYLFFSSRSALIASIFSYVFLGYLYFLQYMEVGSPSFVLEMVLLVFAGFSSVAGLHVVIGLRHSIEHKLISIAQTDALTELPNKMYFNERLDQEISRASREHSPLCLGLIDLDHFKQVNDSYGHECGDRVLAHVANLINESVRATDTACRVGGEEFVIIMPNTKFEEAHHMLERLRVVIENAPFKWKSHRINLTASMGLSKLKVTDGNNSIFADADNAMYLAKQKGRNQVVFIDAEKES